MLCSIHMSSWVWEHYPIFDVVVIHIQLLEVAGWMSIVHTSQHHPTLLLELVLLSNWKKGIFNNVQLSNAMFKFKQFYKFISKFTQQHFGLLQANVITNVLEVLKIFSTSILSNLGFSSNKSFHLHLSSTNDMNSLGLLSNKLKLLKFIFKLLLEAYKKS